MRSSLPLGGWRNGVSQKVARNFTTIVFQAMANLEHKERKG